MQLRLCEGRRRSQYGDLYEGAGCGSRSSAGLALEGRWSLNGRIKASAACALLRCELRADGLLRSPDLVNGMLWVRDGHLRLPRLRYFCAVPQPTPPRIRLRHPACVLFTGGMELLEPPTSWKPDKHRAGTKSRLGRCAWNAPCPNDAVWSVRVEDKGGDSWWAVCEEHRAGSSVLSAQHPTE